MLNSDYVITEREIQVENGVESILFTLPMFEDYVNFNEREANKMYFWARPTIEWKLECEDEGNTR